MQLITISQALVLYSYVIAAQTTNALPLSLVSFNIRYATTNLFENEQPWSTRAPLVVGKLTGLAAGAPPGAETVIGMQEVLHEQLVDILSGLGAEWTHVGVGRDDGLEAGEYSPIVYRPAVLRLLYNETKWLSPTPDVPSKGWAAESYRIVTVGVFEHVATEQRLIAANTHLENGDTTEKADTRTEEVKVVLETIKAVQQKWGPLPISLTGDFNSQPDDNAYSTMVDSGLLSDLHSITTDLQHFGPYDTYTGFLPDEEDSVGKRIDFVWLGPASEHRWIPQRYEVTSNVINDVYISDHRPVLGDVKAVFSST